MPPTACGNSWMTRITGNWRARGQLVESFLLSGNLRFLGPRLANPRPRHKARSRPSSRQPGPIALQPDRNFPAGQPTALMASESYEPFIQPLEAARRPPSIRSSGHNTRVTVDIFPRVSSRKSPSPVTSVLGSASAKLSGTEGNRRSERYRSVFAMPDLLWYSRRTDQDRSATG